ncbi:MAG: 3',5'-cyclic-nucleotide phosphodiesterase [Acidobacteriota bacterium]|nr:3',5'-cyclic-nucleotide phosphodiesterase [Acidobacteriota bacterium]
MRVRVLGAHGGSSPSHRQTSFLVNGTVCVDAGALTDALTLEEQAEVRAVLVTHAHMDHIASLPFLVENVFGRKASPLELVAPEDVLAALRKHLFNDALWPDFSRLLNDFVPAVTYRAVPVGEPFAVGALIGTAIPVSHVVPTVGYILEDRGTSIVFSGDTGPTDALWRAARARTDVKGIFVECSFPNSLQHLADVSKHLTPATLQSEIVKFPPGAPIHLYHMKPPGLPRLRAEVAELGDARVSILADGDVLDF